MYAAFIKTEILLFLLHCFHCRSTAENTGEAVTLFSHSVYKASVREHFPYHNETIQQLLRLDPPLESEDVDITQQPIRYAILSGNDDGYFWMEPATGELFLVRQVDRENLPESIAGRDRFSMIIQASLPSEHGQHSVPETHSSIARLIVDVEDVNDNSPKFDPPVHVISIVENLPVGFNVLKLTAHDPDLGENGRFKYGLIDSSGAFKIDPLTGWLSVVDPVPLDREATDELTIRVIALEERPSLVFLNNESFAQIDVHLTDVNDNSPVFQPSNLYSFSVDAAAETGVIIGQVEALDADADENALVSYAIQQQPQQQNNKENSSSSHVDTFQMIPFSVHPQSGHIIVVDVPLTMDAYTLLIEASDQPTNPNERRISLAVVQILVNRTKQAVIVQFENPTYEFWVNASSPVNTTIGRLKAIGLNDNAVRYTIKSIQRKSMPLGVDLRSGIVRVTRNLTAGSIHTFNVSASDNVNKEAATCVVVVNVKKNEQAAENRVLPFSIEDDVITFRFNVTENAPPSVIGQLVYPPSPGPFGKKKYDFVPQQQQQTKGVAQWPEQLKLSRNGTLYTRAPLDHELIANLTLSVSVQDKGRGRDTVQLIVTVLDINDNGPVFGRPHYIGRIIESAHSGEAIRFDDATAGPIRAFDADSGDVVRYSLSGQGSGFFRIDPVTAQVTVGRSKSLDHKRTSAYHLMVSATDGTFTSSAHLTILVDDENVKAPEINGFIPTNNVVALERSADRHDLMQEGQIVVCADGICSAPVNLDEGDDPPQMPNGRSMATFNRFRSKILSMMDQWLESAERSIDNRSPPEEDEMLERAFQQILHNSSIFIQVPHDFPTNNSIGAFGATSGVDPIWPSTPLQQRLRFSLHSNDSDADAFAIDPFTGILMVKKKLEAEKVYSMEVQVSDHLGLASEMTSVTVQQIGPVINHRPEFVKSFYELFLTEGIYHHVPIIKFDAIDPDEGEDGKLTFSLLADQVASKSLLLPPFEIDEERGTLSVNGMVDREKVDFYRFVVYVSDSGSPPLRNQANVIVHLQDINDNAPQFQPDASSRKNNSIFSVSLPLKTPAGKSVIQIRARDDDADQSTNANITYRLDSHQQLFRIDPRNGTIYTKTPMERAVKYAVVVVATDAGSPRLSSSGTVQIKIEDKFNPCDSNVTLRQQSLSLDEESQGPQMLVNLTSMQADGVKISLLRIEPDTTAFALDELEPVLWLTEPLDREIQPSYSVHLNIRNVNDDSSEINKCANSLNEENLILNVRLLDINDNPPVFAIDDQVVVVSSDTSIGQTIAILTATDVDEGVNAQIEYTLVTELSSSNGAGGFAIDSITGAIYVSSVLRDLAGRILHYQVRATDREGSGLSTSLHLSVHVLDRAHQVALIFGTETEDLITSSQSGNISHAVGGIIGMEVWVKSIEPHVEGDTVDGSITDVILYARNFSSHRLIPSEDLERILDARREELEEKLYLYQLREVRSLSRKPIPATSSQFHMEALEVTLVTIGAAVLLGAAVAIICIVTSKKKLKKRRRFLPTLSMPMPIDYAMSNTPLYGNSDSLISDVSQSSGSKGGEIYSDMSADKSHSLYFAQKHTVLAPPPPPPPPICSNCHRRKHKQCRCSCCGKSPKPTARRISQSTATIGRLSRSQGELYRRSMSSPCYHVHPSRNKKEKQVRLKVPKRSLSERAVRIEPPVVHFEHFQRQDSQGSKSVSNHRSKKYRGSPPIRVDKRHFTYHREGGSDNQHPSVCSSGDTFEDSLE